MNEPTPPPLKLDARLILESISGTLAFVLAGISVIALPEPWSILAPLIVGATIVFINRLLGRSSDAAIAQVQATLDRAVAQNTVFRAEATPTVKRAAEEAADALRPGAVVEPKP